MKNVQKKAERGLTLIEMLIAMSIASAIGVLLLVIIVNSTGLYSNQSAKIQTGVNINDALAQIRSSIKQASAIVPSYTDGQTVYTTGARQLVLKIASVDFANNIITNTFDYFIFLLDQNTLRFKVIPDVASSRPGKDQIFSTSADNIIFEYFNSAVPPLAVDPEQATKVKVSLVLKQKNGTTVETNIATSEANLRND